MPLPADIAAEYPFTPQSITIDGHRYSYIDEGSGPVLLFVHGNPSWSFAWRNLIKGLSNNYRCIAVDHLGMGLSDKPQDYPYTISQHIQNLTTLIDELDLNQISLIGHDWGGCIGMGTAVRESRSIRTIRDDEHRGFSFAVDSETDRDLQDPFFRSFRCAWPQWVCWGCSDSSSSEATLACCQTWLPVSLQLMDESHCCPSLRSGNPSQAITPHIQYVG